MYNIGMKKILLYNIDLETTNTIKDIANKREIAVVLLDDNCLHVPLKDLFLIEEDAVGAGCSFENEYMMMQEISHEELVAIVKEIHARGIEFEAIKIMRTETNANWPLSALLEETSKEHEVMQKVFILQQTLQSCNDIKLDELEEENANQLKQAMVDAYLYLQAGQFEKDTAEEKSKNLMEALRHATRVVH